MTAMSQRPTPEARPTPRQTNSTVVSLGSRMFVRKRTSEAAAKIPNARAALSPTTIIIAPATTAISICVCATYGLRRATDTPRRGRKARRAARNAARAKRNEILAEVDSQLETVAGDSPVVSGPKSSPSNGISPGDSPWLEGETAGDATGPAVVLRAVSGWSRKK